LCEANPVRGGLANWGLRWDHGWCRAGRAIQITPTACASEWQDPKTASDLAGHAL